MAEERSYTEKELEEMANQLLTETEPKDKLKKKAPAKSAAKKKRFRSYCEIGGKEKGARPRAARKDPRGAPERASGKGQEKRQAHPEGHGDAGGSEP